MLNEPSFVPHKVGWIEVICGGMFSGKTEELIRRAKRAHIAGQKVVVVKPKVDDRYDEEDVVSHNQNVLPGLVVDTADQIVLLTGEAEVVCIDEAQFFDKQLMNVANTLANDGKRVIVAKLHAVCAESGTMAHYSQRVVESKDRVLVGETDAYEPRARHCYRPPVDKRRGKPIQPIQKQDNMKEENES
jgi:thymidine kinase